MRPHRWQPTRLPHPWDSPGKNTGVGCHFLLQCIKVKREREVAQSCPTLSDPMDYSLLGSSIHGLFQARGLEWGASAFSVTTCCLSLKPMSHILRFCFIKHLTSDFVVLSDKYSILGMKNTDIYFFLSCLCYLKVWINYYSGGLWWLWVTFNPCAQSLSHEWLLVTPWTIACWAPLSMKFSRQEYWSGLSFPTWRDLPDPRIEPEYLASPSLAGRSFITEPPERP